MVTTTVEPAFCGFRPTAARSVPLNPRSLSPSHSSQMAPTTHPQTIHLGYCLSNRLAEPACLERHPSWLSTVCVSARGARAPSQALRHNMSILLLKKRVRAPTYLPETCDEQLRTRVLSGEFRSIHVEDFGFMGKTSDEKGGRCSQTMCTQTSARKLKYKII